MDKAFWNLIERIKAASCEDELFNLLDEGTQFIGFTQFALGHHVDLNQPPDTAIRLTNYNPSWVRESIGRKYYRNDPVHRASVLDNAPFAWGDLKHMIKLTSKQDDILRRAAQFGLHGGVTVPVHLPGEYRGTCSFAGGIGTGQEDRILGLAHLIGTFAFQAARRIMKARHRTQSILAALPDLTKRQLEVLILLGRGKNDGEIGEILHISQNTAHEHVENIRAAYGGAQRTYLIGRALFDGQITYDEILSSRRSIGAL